MLHAALTLAQQGLAVFPCQPRDKRPATERGCLDATTEPVIIRRWWRSNPDYNVAIATGAVSGVFVGDVDGVDAESELRKLEAEHGALPPTVEAITARGRHVYFKMPPSRMCVILPARSRPASTSEAAAGMCWHRRAFTRAAGPTPGAWIRRAHWRTPPIGC